MPKSMVAPFNVVGGGIAYTTDNREIIEQKILNVIVTSYGERVGIPDYGANIASLLFDHESLLETLDFRADLALAVSRYVPGITIDNVSVQEGGDDGVLNLSIRYLDALSVPQTLNVSLSLPGALTEETPL